MYQYNYICCARACDVTFAAPCVRVHATYTYVISQITLCYNVICGNMYERNYACIMKPRH